MNNSSPKRSVLRVKSFIWCWYYWFLLVVKFDYLNYENGYNLGKASSKIFRAFNGFISGIDPLYRPKHNFSGSLIRMRFSFLNSSISIDDFSDIIFSFVFWRNFYSSFCYLLMVDLDPLWLILLNPRLFRKLFADLDIWDVLFILMLNYEFSCVKPGI